MRTSSQTLIDLETKFWQSMVDQDSDTAVSLLSEPAFMVSAHGSMKFDHAAYRKMAEQGTMTVTSFELSDVEVLFPNDRTAVVTYRVKQAVSARNTGQTTMQEMADSSTWIQSEDNEWRCVMHTETPVEPEAAKHH